MKYNAPPSAGRFRIV